MKICSVCHRCYEDAAANCVENHGNLIEDRSGTLQIIPNYRLDALIKSDAVGKIYSATNIAADQPVIVRIIAQESIAGAGEQALQMLGREVQAAAELEHPNIARVYESGSLDGGDFYIVAESVNGRTLQECLRNIGNFSETEAVTIARQTAEVLTAAHHAGIIHRAVSPANIILFHNRENKLSVKLQNFDFGGIKRQVIVKNSDNDPQIDVLRYLSPEQIEGKSVDEQTDVYSLGVVLYEMLCGRSPFDAPTSAAIFDRRINEQPLSQLSFDFRALLTHTLRESLQTRPAARLQTDNFARQLRHIEKLQLPTGENLRELEQISPLNEASFVKPLNSASGESSIENQFVPEIITSEKINANEPANQFSEQRGVEEIEQETADNIVPWGKWVPVFKMKRETRADSSAETSVSTENENTNADSPTLNPVFDGENQNNRIQTESDFEKIQEHAANDIPALGKMSPVFTIKNDVVDDSLAENSIRVENKNANEYSFEPTPIFVEKKYADEIPLESESVTIENRKIEIPLTEPVNFERRRIEILPTEPEVEVSSAANNADLRRNQTAAPVLADYHNESRPPRRALPKNRAALVGAGLLALLVAVMLGAFLYNRRQQTTISEPTISAAPQTTNAVSDKSADTSEAVQPEISETKSSVTDDEKPSTAAQNSAQKSSENLSKTDNVSNTSGTKQDELTAEQTKPSANNTPQTELNTALDDWVSATNSRDVERQMDYYAPKVNAYYQTRNTSPAAVRAEKKRVFERADAVDIQAGKPDINLSPDGKKATMRFRKKYDIKEGQRNRRGEVIQELQWVKFADGWRIVSERDVKVIN